MAVACGNAVLRYALIRPTFTQCGLRGLCNQAKRASEVSGKPGPSTQDDKGPETEKVEANDNAGVSATPGDNQRTTGASDGRAELEELVTASLEAAKTHGWTTAALQAGATSLGWSPAAAGMVRGGGGELALHHVRRSNRAFASGLAEKYADEGDVRPGKNAAAERVAYAVRTRLLHNAPYRHNWGSALRQLATTQALGSARESALLADEIAHYAGYRTPSAIWYADRAALATLYHATELFWLSDRSQNQAATWIFLRAYTDVALGARGAISGVVGRFGKVHNVGFATLRGLTRSMRAN